MKKESLQKYIDNDLSYSGIARECKVSVSTIRYWMQIHNLSTLRARLPRKNIEFICENCNKPFRLPKLRIGAKFCGRICSSEYRRRLSSNRLSEGKLLSPTTVRKLMLEFEENRCGICLNDKWNGIPIPLVVDHIDGNSENNYKTNLRLICNNCDAQLPTYKSKNKGNGRHLRRERYKEGKSF